MEVTNGTAEEVEDCEFFTNITEKIEKGISDLKKIVNSINQMRVEAAYLQSDLLTTIEANTWQDIASLVGLTSIEVNPQEVNLKY